MPAVHAASDVEAEDGADPQDSAEALDETNYDLSEGVGEMRTFEELPDVLDVTQADGDRDDDEVPGPRRR